MADSELTRAKCAVMAQLRTIPKTGHNKFHGYDYATESDFVRAIAPAMAEHGISVRPARITLERLPAPSTKMGKEQWITQGPVVYELRHVSGETEEIHTFASAIDSEEKGPYKALTGAYKYALRQAFMVATGDDPEDDGRAAPSNEDDAREFRQAIAGRGVNVDKLDGWLASQARPSVLDLGPAGRRALFDELTTAASAGAKAFAAYCAPAAPKTKAKPAEPAADKPAEPAPDKPAHHPSWTESRARFCAALGDLDLPGKHTYDEVAAFAESLGRPRPSAMAPEQRQALVKWLRTDDGRDKWADWQERQAIRGEGT